MRGFFLHTERLVLLCKIQLYLSTCYLGALVNACSYTSSKRRVFFRLHVRDVFIWHIFIKFSQFVLCVIVCTFFVFGLKALVPIRK